MKTDKLGKELLETIQNVLRLSQVRSLLVVSLVYFLILVHLSVLEFNVLSIFTEQVQILFRGQLRIISGTGFL